VDFVVSRGARSWALEVKSGRGGKPAGVAAFRRRYPKAGAWLIGESGVALADFFARPAEHWFA
jgi:hypothetical protein